MIYKSKANDSGRCESKLFLDLRKANWAHFRTGLKGTAHELCLPDALLITDVQ